MHNCLSHELEHISIPSITHLSLDTKRKPTGELIPQIITQALSSQYAQNRKKPLIVRQGNAKRGFASLFSRNVRSLVPKEPALSHESCNSDPIVENTGFETYFAIEHYMSSLTAWRCPVAIYRLAPRTRNPKLW